MKLLFIGSGNSVSGLSPILQNQIDSLCELSSDISVSYYAIKGNGVFGYLSNLNSLRKLLSANSFDVVHAHYSLSAFLANLAGARPLVVSLMGNDVLEGPVNKRLVNFFSSVYSWKAVIVKSEEMKCSLGNKKAYVVPNGVDIRRFVPIERSECRRQLGWDENHVHVLFASDPQRSEKNYQLVYAALANINDSSIIIHFLKNIPNSQTPVWYNAANVVILSSLWEGSPNSIKEAMACDCPILSTDVGDVKYLFGNIEGCFLSGFSISEYSVKLRQAIDYSKTYVKTNGRNRIIELGLDSETIAHRLFEIYKSVL